MVANKNANKTNNKNVNKNVNNNVNKKIAAAKGNKKILEKFSTQDLVEYCDSELIRVVKSKRQIINAIHRFWAYESTDSEEYSSTDSDSSDSDSSYSEYSSDSSDSEYSSDSGSSESDSE
jgi:hypothetical protein